MTNKLSTFIFKTLIDFHLAINNVIELIGKLIDWYQGQTLPTTTIADQETRLGLLDDHLKAMKDGTTKEPLEDFIKYEEAQGVTADNFKSFGQLYTYNSTNNTYDKATAFNSEVTVYYTKNDEEIPDYAVISSYLTKIDNLNSALVKINANAFSRCWNVIPKRTFEKL